MTFSPLLFSDKHLTLDVSIVEKLAKTRYGGLLLVDNRWCIALCKALRIATLDVTLWEGDEILKPFLHRQRANYFPNFSMAFSLRPVLSISRDKRFFT